MLIKCVSNYPLEKKTKGAAAYDLACSETTIIPPFGSAIVSTGVHLQFPPKTFGLVTLRSGHGFRDNLFCHIGIIDTDYRGEVKVKVFNFSDFTAKLVGGERFAQVTVLPVVPSWVMNVDTLEDTERGNKGFGHTGVMS
jgi:dUTP pyrophosphatase